MTHCVRKTKIPISSRTQHDGETLLRVAAGEPLPFFDVMSIHLYFNRRNVYGSDNLASWRITFEVSLCSAKSCPVTVIYMQQALKALCKTSFNAQHGRDAVDRFLMNKLKRANCHTGLSHCRCRCPPVPAAEPRACPRCTCVMLGQQGEAGTGLCCTQSARIHAERPISAIILH